MINSIIGVLILVAEVWAILNIGQSRESTGSKALWVVLVLVLPVIGLLIWYFAGPKASTG